MVDEMYMEELKEEEKSNPNPNPNASSSDQLYAEEQKPVLGLLINDSDSLSSIINNQQHHHLNGENIITNNSNNPNPNPNFGVVDLDFSSYSGSGVSLTLGLQEQQSLLFSREHIDDNRPVQFSILDEEGQNLPYRNLMGAQLLHDLAGWRGNWKKEGNGIFKW